MNKYRKKPVVIDAWLWDETRTTFNLLRAAGMKSAGYNGHANTPDLVADLRIKTLEGALHASKGDYIICGVRGEFYSCKPDIFAQTYEPANTRSSLVSGVPEGWRYKDGPAEGADARCLVTLEQDGMVWVGVRAWHGAERKWLNNGEPSSEKALAWKPMPSPAKGRWVHGKLLLAEPDAVIYESAVSDAAGRIGRAAQDSSTTNCNFANDAAKRSK